MADLRRARVPLLPTRALSRGRSSELQELYEAHPNRQMMHSDARMHDIYHHSLRDRCRADAIEEALQRHAPEPVTYFAGYSARVGDFEVHPVLGVNTHALATVPQLTTSERDRFAITRSLVHGCIQAALSPWHGRRSTSPTPATRSMCLA